MGRGQEMDPTCLSVPGSHPLLPELVLLIGCASSPNMAGQPPWHPPRLMALTPRVSAARRTISAVVSVSEGQGALQDLCKDVGIRVLVHSTQRLRVRKEDVDSKIRDDKIGMSS
jgi:hypothetical protein